MINRSSLAQLIILAGVATLLLLGPQTGLAETVSSEIFVPFKATVQVSTVGGTLAYVKIKGKVRVGTQAFWVNGTITGIELNFSLFDVTAQDADGLLYDAGGSTQLYWPSDHSNIPEIPHPFYVTFGLAPQPLPPFSPNARFPLFIGMHITFSNVGTLDKASVGSVFVSGWKDANWIYNPETLPPGKSGTNCNNDFFPLFLCDMQPYNPEFVCWERTTGYDFAREQFSGIHCANLTQCESKQGYLEGIRLCVFPPVVGQVTACGITGPAGCANCVLSIECLP